MEWSDYFTKRAKTVTTEASAEVEFDFLGSFWDFLNITHTDLTLNSTEQIFFPGKKSWMKIVLF